MSKELKEMMEPGTSLLNALKSIEFKSKFNNKAFLLPIVIKRYDAQEIDNAVSFLNELTALWATLVGKGKTKAIVLLEAFINYYFPPVRKIEIQD